MAQLPVRAASFTAARPRIDDDSQRLLWKIAVLLSTAAGGGGVLAVGGAGAFTGPFVRYHALTNTVVTSVTYSDGSTFPGGSTVLAGDSIAGNIKSIVIASGAGELYRAII